MEAHKQEKGVVVEDLIRQIIGLEGGQVPSDFFIGKLRKMEDKGALKIVFDDPRKMVSHRYNYQIVKG